MDEYFLLNLIDIIRDTINADSQALAIFGSTLGEDEDSSVDALFSHYFRIEERIQFLFVSAIFDKAGIRESPEETEFTDIILDRFFDDDVRSGEVSSQELLDQFLSEAETYYSENLWKGKEDNPYEHV